MKDELPRFLLETDAHNLDEEFEKIIQEDYGVKIVDRTREPWSVVFEGERELLIKMVHDHWGGIELDPSELVPVGGSSA